MKTKRKLVWKIAIVALFMATIIVGCKKDEDIGIRPKVTSTDPINKATGIAVNSTISAIFSVGMDPSTITVANFTLQKGTATVTGTTGYTGSTATFNPASNLDPNSNYTATITTGVQDLDGKSLAKDYIWTFTTGAIPDVTLPTVTATDPANNATEVTLNKVIVATFSEPMDPPTVTSLTFTLKQGETSVPGVVTCTGTTGTFTPASNLEPNKIYTGTITIGAKDMSGNALASNFTFSFTTGNAPDILLPMVNSTDPVNNATDVLLNKVVSLTFSEAMDPLTINNTTFTLKNGETTVTGIVTKTATTATFTPSADLLPGTVYTATITTGVKDLTGNPLAANTVWTFTTGVLPTVISTDPANLATGVVLNKTVTAEFSAPMDPLTLTGTTFTVKQGASSVAGTVSYTGTTASFNSSGNLLPSTTYTVTVTTGAKSQPGFQLAVDYVWTFTTGELPTVISTDPANLATGVVLNKTVTAESKYKIPVILVFLMAVVFDYRLIMHSLESKFIEFGIALGGATAIYLVLNRYYGKGPKIFFIKEVWITIIYSIAIWGGPIIEAGDRINIVQGLLFFAFGLLIFSNVLICSFFEREIDSREGLRSFALDFGEELTLKLSIIAAGMAIIIAVVTYITFRVNGIPALILILIGTGYLSIMMRRNLFVDKESYGTLANLLLLLSFLSIIG